MKPYSEDLRARIVQGRQEGQSVIELAKRYGVSKSSVERYCLLHAQTGGYAAGQVGGHRRSRLAGHEQTLRRWIQQRADLTLAELQVRCRERLGIGIGINALWHRLDRLNLSYKKTLHAAEQNRPDIKAARRVWRSQQRGWDIRRLVFLDETGLNTKMTRLCGRALRGQRCLARVPHGHWSTATLVVALRYDRWSAPLLLDGPMEGAMFLAYIQQGLAPELQSGDLVICDNLSSHKVAGVSEAIQARDATLLYLPAYSPDLNPIEMAFAKLKAHLRQAARRSFTGLLKATAGALESFSPAQCRSFFRHARYTSI